MLNEPKIRTDTEVSVLIFLHPKDLNYDLSVLHQNDVNCFKGFALPVEAKEKPLKTLKLAFQSFAKAKAEMASFEMGVVGSRNDLSVPPLERS